jgi:lysozyme
MRGTLTFGAGTYTYWTAQWSGRLRFEPTWKIFTKTPTYVLARGSTVSWTLSGSDDDCTYSGSGSLDFRKLKGELVVGSQVREGLWHYNIEVRAGDSADGKPVMPINQTCAGASSVADAAGAHGRFPFVVTGIFGQVAARNTQTNSVALNGDAREQGSTWTWRVAGPVFADEISEHGIDFIKDWELLWQPCTSGGKRWTNFGKTAPAAYRFVCAYDDTSAKPNCTIGYGKLLHYGRCTAADNRLRWTHEQAEEQLYDEVKQQKYQGVVRAFSRKYGLSQCQFDALMAFVYNAGPGGFKWLTAPPRASDIGFKPAGKLPLQGWEAVVGQRLPRYTTAGGKILAGLVRRRMAEFILFMTAKCPCQGVAGPRTNDKRIPKIDIDPCKPPPGYAKAKYCPR